MLFFFPFIIHISSLSFLSATVILKMPAWDSGGSFVPLAVTFKKCLLICTFHQESDAWVCTDGVEEHYFNTRLSIYSSNFAHTIALGGTKTKQQNIICNNLPSSITNRTSTRRESGSPCLSQCTLVHVITALGWLNAFWLFTIFNLTNVITELNFEVTVSSLPHQ